MAWLRGHMGSSRQRAGRKKGRTRGGAHVFIRVHG